MGKIQDSLKENLEEIKAALPEEFHDGLIAEIDSAEDPVEMSEEETKKAIEAELISNSEVDKSTREALCAAGIEIPERAIFPSEDEQKQHLKETLAATKSEVEKT